MGRNTKEMKLSTICIVALALSAAVVFVQADELKDLSSADVAAPVEEASLEKSSVAPAEKKSDLGESTGSMFSGALLTSGSFTMTATSSFEEEELGESEEAGSMFSGALLTSGSFTMMATSSF